MPNRHIENSRCTARKTSGTQDTRRFSFPSTLLAEFLEFSVEWFAFRKFSSFQNFWKLFREISEPLLLLTFTKVLVE